MSRISAFRSRSRKPRHRILFHEQLEDRSLLTIIITDSTNINLANSQIEVDGDTSDNPNVVNGPVEPLLAYSASASAGDLGGLYGLSNLNDGDIGVGIPSDGTYAIPFNGTLTLSFGGTQTISSIAIYNGYGNRDDGTYLLQDAANNTLGGYTISGSGPFNPFNNGVDSLWLTFTTPVTTTALKLTFAVPDFDNSTASFREIQVFGTAVPESTNDVAGSDIPSGVSMSGSILRFNGGDGAEVVTVSNGNLVVNGTAYSLAGVTEVRIWGRGGNDQIDLSGLAVRAFMNGGNGNDALTGGSSDDVIFGEAGDDTITGAAGNDFLIGGVGKDRLVGSAGNDILVAGDVDSTLDILALQAIRQEWAASHSTSEAESIDSALDETLGDGNSDLLTGGAGADLFIINWDDRITDFQFGKPKTNKDGDVVIRDGLVAT